MQKESFKKIPENAVLVFKGILHDVYHWDQEQFDGSVKTFEALSRRDGLVVVAITTENKFIVNYEEHPGYPQFITLPGGNAEPGQENLEGAKRELLEESGYTSESWVLWFRKDILGYKTLDWSEEFYIARNCRQTMEANFDSGEKIETQILDYEDFLKITQDARFRNKTLTKIVKDILNSENVEEEKEKFRRFLVGEK